MLTAIPIVSVILLVALLGFAATRPDSFSVERAARIEAPPNEVFSLIVDFKQGTFAGFTLKSSGASTDITWSLYGPQPCLAKLLTTFFNRDRLIGKDFETAVAHLRAIATNQSRSEICN
jgi:hypothetical protein